MKKDSLYFDKHAKLYDEVRPDYPDEIYKIIAENLDESDYENWLEIGAGNGVSSVQIIDKLRPKKITLLEPGVNFVEILKAKFSPKDNVEIIQSTFEEFQNSEKFDVILAATSWHWLDLETKYSRVSKLLKPAGKLIIFRNYYGLENNKPKTLINENNDEDLIAGIDALYQKYGGKTVQEASNSQSDRIDARHKEVAESEQFVTEKVETLEWHKSVDADMYIKLLRTFQDATYFGEKFFEELHAIISRNGGFIEERIITDLIIARKSVLEESDHTLTKTEAL